MSAAAASPKPAPITVGSPATLALYRDDGPIARAIGGAVSLPVPAFALTLLAVLPLLVAIAVKGDEAPDALAGIVVAWAVVVGGLSRGAKDASGLRWVSPPLLRAAEYGGLIWLGSLAGAEAAAFALIAVCAFRHYDLVYRLRTRSETPPAWLNAVSGGWEGRLVVAWLLLVLDLLPGGLFAYAGLLAALFAAETVTSWRQFLASQRGSATQTYDEEEDETQ